MDGSKRNDGKPYLAALDAMRRRDAGKSGGGVNGLIQWLMWYLVRPGGFTGSAGRAQSISEVLTLTLPQMMFFAYEKASSSGSVADGMSAKRSVDDKWDDPAFREKYKSSADEAIKKAKEGLVR